MSYGYSPKIIMHYSETSQYLHGARISLMEDCYHLCHLFNNRDVDRKQVDKTHKNSN